MMAVLVLLMLGSFGALVLINVPLIKQVALVVFALSIILMSDQDRAPLPMRAAAPPDIAMSIPPTPEPPDTRKTYRVLTTVSDGYRSYSVAFSGNLTPLACDHLLAWIQRATPAVTPMMVCADTGREMPH